MDTRPDRPVRRAPRTLIVVLAVALVVGLGAWLALALAFPPARVHALVEAQLGRMVTRQVRFESVGLQPFPPVRMSVRGLALAEPGGFRRGVALDAREIRLDLDPWALLRRAFVVRSLAIVKPSIHLALRADGGSNFDSLLAPAPKRRGAPMDLDVRRFVIDGGRVLVDDLRARRRVAAGLDADLAFSSLSGGRRLATSGSTRLSEVSFGPLTARRISDLDRSLAKLPLALVHRGRYDADSARLSLERLEIELGDATVTLAGTIDHPGPAATLDLRTRGRNLDLDDLLGYLGDADARLLHGIEGAGHVEFDLAVRGAIGPGRRPTLLGTVAVTDGAFRYPDAPVGVEGIRFRARFGPDALDIPDLVARVADQPVRAQLGLRRFDDPLARFAVQGTVDLGAISPWVAPRDVKVAGRAELNLRGDGRVKDPGAMALEGRAQLSNVRVEAPRLPKPVEKISAAIAFSPARAQIRGFTARAGGSSFRLGADATRPLALLSAPGSVPPAELHFTFESPRLDVAELVPPGPADPIRLNARGEGKVAIAHFRNDKLEVRNLAADVRLAPGTISVPAFAGQAYGGVVRGRADLDFRNPTGLAFAVDGRAEGVRAEQFLSVWTPARELLTGVVDGSFQASGVGLEPPQVKNSLDALGHVHVTDGRIAGHAVDEIADLTRTPQFRTLKFKDLALPFRVERGRVVTDSARISGPHGDWRISGLVGFDGSLDYAVSTTLPPEVASGLGIAPALAAGALTDDKGRVLIDLRVTGTAKEPRVTWNAKSMRDRLAGRASSVLAEQRQKIEDVLKRGTIGSVESTGVVSRPDARELGKEIENQGRDLLDALLGRKKKSAASDTAKTTTVPDTVRRDSTP